MANGARQKCRPTEALATVKHVHLLFTSEDYLTFREDPAPM
jgi:hypothetical protein